MHRLFKFDWYRLWSMYTAAIWTISIRYACHAMYLWYHGLQCQYRVLARHRLSIVLAHHHQHPLLPILSSFSTPVTCMGSSNYNLTATNIFCAVLQGSVYQQNIPGCPNYVANHTVMCRLIYTINGTGFYPPLRSGFTFEDYDSNFDSFWLIYRYYVSVGLMDMIIYEGTNNMAFIIPNYYIICYCTTNNCSIDLNTCASGLNINISLVFGNNMIPSVSTGSTHTHCWQHEYADV